LTLETVQKDLGLTANQIVEIEKIDKLSNSESNKFFANHRKILPRGQQFTPEEVQARLQKSRVLFEDFKLQFKERQKEALALLTPSQIERLKQIQLQIAIPTALTRPDIVKALDISEEQLAKIHTLDEEINHNLSRIFPDLRRLDSKERRQKFIDYRKMVDQKKVEAAKHILDVLTPEQRAKFEKLQGNKIDMTPNYEAQTPDDSEFWKPYIE
jgi:hypothetical protein